jgi:hypothetical protein
MCTKLRVSDLTTKLPTIYVVEKANRCQRRSRQNSNRDNKKIGSNVRCGSKCEILALSSRSHGLLSLTVAVRHRKSSAISSPRTVAYYIAWSKRQDTLLPKPAAPP